ncbi:MAG TPA: EF-hand domain-containing protein, partial [Polyangiaceae bacterium]|nr:EF-hand domain-containing protein [Polyangiaceae bacterium]
MPIDRHAAAHQGLRLLAQNPSRHDPLGVPPSSRPARSLDPRLLECLSHAFKGHAGTDQLIDAGDLQRALRIRNAFLAERMLVILDRDGDGRVSREEFLAGVRRLVFGSTRDKLRLAFQIHDLDGNGWIEPEEVRRMIAMNLDEEAGSDASGAPSMRRREDRVQELTHLLLSTADDNGDKNLCFEEFERIAACDAQLFDLISKSEAHWLLPDGESLKPAKPPASWQLRLRRLAENRSSLVVFFVLWAIANAAILVTCALRYEAEGP